MAVTISDIAKEANVSLATVSRVLNNSGYVKDDTRKKILKIIKKLNYTPSAIAQSLSKNETSTIGVIVPDITNPFFGEIIKGISQIADENDLNIILCNSNENLDKELKSIQTLRAQRIRGLIISPTSADNNENSESLKTLDKLGIPVVLVDGHLKSPNFSGVFVDSVQGAFDGVNALIKEGHEKIGIITGRMNSKPAKDRLLGYKKALLLNNIPFNSDYVFYGDYSQESGYHLTKKLFLQKDKPTALFVCNNMMTLGCLKALLEEGYKVPDDISLLSFDRIDILNILGIPISHINGPSTKLGKIGMQLLIDSLKNKKTLEFKNITLTPQLVLLGSEKCLS